jgi:hypothetical protein
MSRRLVIKVGRLNARNQSWCDENSKAKYHALKARGCSHARALRTIDDRLFVATKTAAVRPLFRKPKMRLINRGKRMLARMAVATQIYNPRAVQRYCRLLRCIRGIDGY